MELPDNYYKDEEMEEGEIRESDDSDVPPRVTASNDEEDYPRLQLY